MLLSILTLEQDSFSGRTRHTVVINTYIYMSVTLHFSGIEKLIYFLVATDVTSMKLHTER